MQYMVVALACLSFKSQAARVLSKAHFVPAIHVPRHIAQFAWEPGNGTIETNDPVAPQDIDAEWPVQKGEGPIDVEAERTALKQAVDYLVAQPKIPWSTHECLGRDVTVPKMDYQIDNQASKASKASDEVVSRISTPDGAYGILDGGMIDLALWTPWNLRSLLVIMTGGERVLDDPEVVKDAEYDILPSQYQEWSHLRRGECCGQRATIAVENNGDLVRAKLKCLGAAEGDRCRMKGSFQLLFDRSDCAAGLKCKELDSGYIPEYGVGACKPA